MSPEIGWKRESRVWVDEWMIHEGGELRGWAVNGALARLGCVLLGENRCASGG